MKFSARRRGWRAAIGVAAIALLAGTAAAGWILTSPHPAFRTDDASVPDRAGDAQRGRLIFASGDCASCHASPGQTDRRRLGGGLALASPYGTLHVPNISQDPVDGIGRWRTVDLANAMLSGVSPTSSHYYPVFPYGSYSRMQLNDVVDLMAYLRTLPGVQGRPPEHELAFPFNVRRLIGFWKLIYLDRSPIEPMAGRSAPWNRGRYLVEAVAHCAECHSSRNVLGGIKPTTRFAGGRDPEGTGFVPNITPAGIGSWSEADIAALLDRGQTPDLRTVGSSMAGVVENTHSLTPADREAMAVYVKTLLPRPTAEP
jgi:mono/diheme cytochrome c family protein